MTDLFLYDETIRAEGFVHFCGVDEAGRGPLAGPVYAAAIVFEAGTFIDGLDDSKKLSAKKREALLPLIIDKCAAYGIASASVSEIAKLNILGATILAMNRAISSLGVSPELALIDGNFCRGINIPCRSVIKGDSISASIAAASVLAKTARDSHMTELDKIYPQYGFAKHKGYATRAHYDAIRLHGPSAEHRLKFLEKMH